MAFDPNKRMTIEEALEHPFMIELSQQGDAPPCDRPFDFEFEKKYLESGTNIPKSQLQRLMFEEMMRYEIVPDPAETDGKSPHADEEDPAVQEDKDDAMD